MGYDSIMKVVICWLGNDYISLVSMGVHTVHCNSVNVMSRYQVTKIWINDLLSEAGYMQYDQSS